MPETQTFRWASITPYHPRAMKKPSKQQDVPALGDVLDFMRVLWSVDHGLQSTSKRMRRSLGVTGSQRLVIRMVGRFPGVSAGRIADLLRLDPSTLTGVLRRLEAAGALRRAPDPKDARRALFVLTEKGQKIDALRSGTVEAVVRRVLAGTPPAKVQIAREVLEALANELERT